jgi:DNA-binding NarL/FixJ family response regulator
MWQEQDPLRVLIADDDERHAALVAGLLQEVDELEVVGIAKDGEEAVQLACWQDADIVVMDLEMPKIDGITATRLVREARPRLCVLMLSGADPARIDEARDAGAAGYVDKSSAFTDLVPALLALCAGAAGPV